MYLIKKGCFPNNIISWISRNFPVDSRKRYASLSIGPVKWETNFKKYFLDYVYEYSTARKERNSSD